MIHILVLEMNNLHCAQRYQNPSTPPRTPYVEHTHQITYMAAPIAIAPQTGAAVFMAALPVEVDVPVPVAVAALRALEAELALDSAALLMLDAADRALDLAGPVAVAATLLQLDTALEASDSAEETTLPARDVADEKADPPIDMPELIAPPPIDVPEENAPPAIDLPVEIAPAASEVAVEMAPPAIDVTESIMLPRFCADEV